MLTLYVLCLYLREKCSGLIIRQSQLSLSLVKVDTTAAPVLYIVGQ